MSADAFVSRDNSREKYDVNKTNLTAVPRVEVILLEAQRGRKKTRLRRRDQRRERTRVLHTRWPTTCTPAIRVSHRYYFINFFASRLACRYSGSTGLRVPLPTVSPSLRNRDRPTSRGRNVRKMIRSGEPTPNHLHVRSNDGMSRTIFARCRKKD